MSAKKVVSKKSVKPKRSSQFYTCTLTAEGAGSLFTKEYNIILKTIEAVNSFRDLYKTGRTATRRGPATHAQRDLYRAMLVFSCAGLDVLVKELITSKLQQLIDVDEAAQAKFKEYIKRGLEKGEKEILNTVALALIDTKPRDIFLKDYIQNITNDSLQSVEQLMRCSNISGLNTKQIFTTEKQNQLKDAFLVRNQIIHEMDLNLVANSFRDSTYRAIRVRKAETMEKHTRAVLDLAQEVFSAYKMKFDQLKIGVEKKA